MIRGAALTLIFALASCGDFPRDGEDSLNKAKAGEPVAVGYSLAAPWVVAGGGEPTGLEPDLIRAWARAEGVQLRWVEGGEAQIVEGLHQGTLQLAVGGFTDKNPQVARTGMTQPYLTAEIVVGASPGTPHPESLDKVELRYDRRRPEFAAAIRAAGAIPVAAGPGELAPLAAVYAPEVERLKLEATGKRLRKERRVIGTAAGENALAFSLDRFLHARRAAIQARLGEEAGR